MTTHQQKQIEVINRIESQIKSNNLQFSTVAPIENYDNDQRICLTSIHIPSASLKQKIQDEIIEPLKEIASDVYFYSPDSLHMTIKNIRVINNPPHFVLSDIKKAKQVFSKVIPQHNKFKVYFYKLLLFPNNLALIGTTESELDNIVLDLDKKLEEAGIPDDKQYINSQYFFINMTLARFTVSSKKFIDKVGKLSEHNQFDPYIIDSVNLITCNAVLKNLQLHGNYFLN